MDKKEAAKILFEQGWSQKAIAETVGVTAKTICTWVEKGKWDEKRLQHSISRETAEEKVWKLINFQLKVLERIADLQEEVLKDDSLDIASLQKTLTSKGDIDALQKLFTTIKGKELEWTTVVKVIRELMEYLELHNLDLAKQIIPLSNMFINEKRNDL